MNTLRRMIFFLFILLIAEGAYQVSAAHFAVTDASFVFPGSSSATTANLTAGVGFQDRVIALRLNITNITGWDGVDGTIIDSFWDNISNITVRAVDSNGQQILLGSNTTGPGNGGTLLVEDIVANGGDYVYAVEVLLTYNSSLLNESNVPSTGSITLNTTFEILNLTGDGEFNESIDNTGHSVLFDVFGPSVKIKLLDVNNKEKTTFPATDKVKIVCTRSSSLSSFNDTNISISVPGGNTLDHLETSTARASVATDFEVEFTQTREIGDYTAACFTLDDNSLLNDTTNTTFTIVKKLSKGGLSKDSQKPIGNKIVSGTEDLGTVSEQGTSRLLRKGASLKVDVKGETHTIAVKELSPAAVTLTIESTPQDVTINKGETKEVDVDGDGQNDFAITFHQQFKSGASATADITLKAVSTPAEPKKDVGKQPATTTEDQVKGSFAGSAIVTVLVIIAVIVIGFALIRGKKK